jgi:hypothetical protein
MKDLTLAEVVQLIFKQKDIVEAAIAKTAALDAEDLAEQERFIVNLGR